MNAHKTVIVTGNIKDGPLQYTCYPVDEFRKGKWHVAVSAVSFVSKSNINLSCTLTSNFVTNQKRGHNGDIKTYEEPIVTFLMSGVLDKIVVIRFSGNVNPQ